MKKAVKYILFFVLVAILAVSVYANVDQTQPWHTINQIAKTSSDLTSFDENKDGKLDAVEVKNAAGQDSKIIVDAVAGRFAALDFYRGGAPKWGVGMSSSDNFYIDRAGIGNAVTILSSNGNVGIGTTSPNQKLVVVGTINTINITFGDGTTQATAASAAAAYVGATTDIYNGAGVGGYSGGNAKCNAQIPGSRMCHSSDFIRGLPSLTGWYNTFAFHANVPIPPYPTPLAGDCRGWTTSAVNGYYGPIWESSTPAPDAMLCNYETKILCCK